MKKLKKYFFSFFLVLLVLVDSLCVFCVPTFAANSVSADDIIKYILTSDGYALSESVYQSLFGSSNISNTFDTWEDSHSGGGFSRGYQEFYDENVTTDSDGNVTTSTEFNTFIFDSFNSYMNDNPLGYHMVYVRGYNGLNSAIFNNYDWYLKVQNFIRNGPHFTIMSLSAMPYTSFYGSGFAYTINDNGIDFVLSGTVSDGVLTNTQVAINWNRSNDMLSFAFSYPNSVKAYTLSGDTISEFVYPGGYRYEVNAVLNTYGLGAYNIYTNKSGGENIRVFPNIDAYKAYDSASPQPYYFYNPSNSAPTSFNSSDMANSNNVYSVITSNVTSGLSGDEVNEIIKSALDGKISLGGGSSSVSIDIGFIDAASIKGALSDLNTSYVNGFASWFGYIFNYMPKSLTIVFGLAAALSIGYFILRLLRGF